MKSINPKTFAIAIGAILIMAIVPILIKSVNANVFTIGLGRLGLTVFFISLYFAYKKGYSKINGVRDWFDLFIIGFVFGLHWLTYFLSIKLSSASIGVIGVSTFGIHLLILNWLFKGQRVTLFEFGAVLVCFAGCLLVVPEFSLRNSNTTGLLIGVLSGFLYACLPLLHQRADRIPTSTRAWGQFVFALVVFLPFAGQSQWQLAPADWLKLLVLGLLCTLIAHSMWVKASTELPGVVTGLVYYLYIPIAIVLSAAFLGEKITLPVIVGGLLILSANIGQTMFSWKKYLR